LPNVCSSNGQFAFYACFPNVSSPTSPSLTGRIRKGEKYPVGLGRGETCPAGLGRGEHALGLVGSG